MSAFLQRIDSITIPFAWRLRPKLAASCRMICRASSSDRTHTGGRIAEPAFVRVAFSSDARTSGIALTASRTGATLAGTPLVEAVPGRRVDQGGPSCLTIDGFRKFIVEPAQTPVRCYISTYLVGGLYGHQHVELYGPHGIDFGSTVRSIEANRDIVRGIKSHAEPGNYSRWGIAVLEKSKEIGRATGLPVYIHLGTLWPVQRGVEVDPAQLIREIVPLLDPGDVLAHPFTRHPSGFSDPQGKVHPLVFEAVQRGVVIDVGRGSHFSIAAARAVLDAGILPYTLGADLHGYNIKPGTGYDGTFRDNATFGAGTTEDSEGPAFSLHYAMTEMLALGIPLQHVIAMVTANAAKLLREDDSIGALSEGRVADIAVLELQAGDFVLRDGLDATMQAARRFRPAFTLKAGKMFKPVSGYLPYWERMAA